MNQWEKLKAHCKAHKQAENRKVNKAKQTYFQRFQTKLENLPVESWWTTKQVGQKIIITRI